MLVKTIAVLTSGGDSPGMNPAVRAVARTAIQKGIRVFGFLNGFQGILDDDLLELGQRTLAGLLDRGGTFLQSSRCKAFYTEEGRLQAVRKLRDHRIDGLVVIGGDGSLRGALELSRYGVPVIGLPGTIDNDIFGTELGIGVDTTSNTIISMIDKIKDTARSHRRCFLIEVMGRNSGYLALTTAITTGAEVAVIPEYRYNMGRILGLMESRYRNRLNDSIIILAEGVCDAESFTRQMREAAGDNLKQEIRRTVLGYVQRGGSPSHADRLMASQMGEFATLALLQGEHGSLVGLNKGRLTLVDLEKVCSSKKSLPMEKLRLARNLGIEIGDPVEV
ncbi:MAG TPA: ATP-dependent 6-phosphofructokinase [Chthoniobacteraceae bacterium]|nr:ATP-dependent 6-phosphofructokinase [Chthoniobacteraceae bacterium]